jgi:acetyl-CoA carboxylase biotin carboxyl carrier protein
MYSLEELKTLITFIDNSNVGELFIENESFTIRIRAKDYASKSIISPQIQTAPSMLPTPSTPAPILQHVEVVEKSSPTDIAVAENYIEIKSPMIGTFYRASSPDNPPFVKVGDKIKKGDVLGMIEAMKLFNEIHSEYDGTVVRVIADNATPVEYDQVLLWIQQ